MFRAPILALGAVLLLGAPAFGAFDDEAAAAAPRMVKLKIRADTSGEPRPMNPLGPTPRNFRGELLRLRQLAADPAVAAVQLDLDGIPNWADSLELLDELRAVKAAGKKIVCYAETLTQRDLLFASLAELLVVPPSGMIALEGLQAELYYLADLLAKIDVKVEVLHVGEFKTAYEDLALPAMSDAQREVIGSILDELWGQMLDTISTQRGRPRADIERLFDAIFVPPALAAQSGLIDAVAYEDEFEARVAALLGAEPEVVKNYGDEDAEDLEKMLASPFAAFSLLPKLLNPPKREAPQVPHVAIVYATGPIDSGKSKAGFDGKIASMGSETIVAALDEAREDDNAKAVVLRVNSPGGSALASDMIWRAVQRVKAVKPVVVSMGAVAGSGGYWISMGATAIVAQPSTLTGSIGVVSMLPDLSTALHDLGINVEVVARGPHGDSLSLMKHGPTDTLRRVLNGFMNSVYREFLDKVASGRKLALADVEGLARGRVWTGRQAEANGLVDELGGLQDAIDLAAVLGGVESGAPVAEYPEPPNLMEALEEAFEGLATTGARGAFPSDALAGLVGRLPALAGLLPLVDSALRDVSALHPGRVQAVMPFAVEVR